MGLSYVPCFLTLVLVWSIVTTSGQTVGCKMEPCDPCHCQTTRSCGGTLRNSGRFSTHDLESSENLTCVNCVWTLSVSHGNKVHVRFEQFDIGDGDWMKVRDGRTRSSPVIARIETGYVPQEMVSSSNTVQVIFRSNGCSQSRRVIISFSQIDCGGHIKLSEGANAYVRSPNYPKAYRNNANCVWTVTGNYGLTNFAIAISKVDVQAKSDVLEIKELLGRKSLYSSNVRRNNKKAKTIMHQDAPGITIRFRSDNRIRKRGFTIRVKASQSDLFCSETPEKFPQGKFAVKDFRTSATFSCCTGYKLEGHAQFQCQKGQWYPRELPTCLRLPKRTCPAFEAQEGVTITSEVKSANQWKLELTCNHPFKLVGTTARVITADCVCSGRWSYDPMEPTCERKKCSLPPLAPTNGFITGSLDYFIGDRVNYSCPSGYGLNGIPFRKCNDELKWEPSSNLHECIHGLRTCLDPGIPENGKRKGWSFAHEHMTSYSCNPGFKFGGSRQRICQMTQNAQLEWDGQPATCTSIFKSTDELAAQLRETFVDRTVTCMDRNRKTLPDDPVTTSPTTLSSNSTPSITRNLTTLPPQVSNQFNQFPSSSCLGRSVVVGTGCVDLIFAVDSSGSMAKDGKFAKSLVFVEKSLFLFAEHISAGTTRVALVTYDHKVHPRINIYNNFTYEEIVDEIKATIHTAGSTSTDKVLQHIKDSIVPKTRKDCKKAVFLLTDGDNNWGGNPEAIATSLKNVAGLDLYAITFGTNNRNWDSLKSLVSKEEYFFAAENPDNVTLALGVMFFQNTSYDECGKTSSTQCDGVSSSVCRSKEGAWPWVVAIYLRHGGIGPAEFLCGGTLISPCHVLTAAHCVRQDHIRKDYLFVNLGDTKRRRNEHTEQTYKVHKIELPSNYDGELFHYDVTILRLSCNAKLNNFVRKGCLPQSSDDQLYKSGLKCLVAGWGTTERANKTQVSSGLPENNLKTIQVPVADINICRSTAEGNGQSISDSTFCAGDGTGITGTCKGDSGSPFFCKRDDSESYVVTGIVSWGNGCRHPGEFGHYTSVRAVMDFIEKAQADTECPTTDNCQTLVETIV